MRGKKWLIFPLLLLTGLLLLSGCDGKPLPEGMEEDTLIQAGEEVLGHLTAGEYQAVADAFRPDMQQTYSVTAETVQAAMDTVAEAGAYVRTTDTVTAGGNEKNFEEPYGVVLLYCEHEKKDVLYEFSFDTGLELIGLAVKLQ